MAAPTETDLLSSFDVEAKKIGERYFVRVTFPTGETETLYGYIDQGQRNPLD